MLLKNGCFVPRYEAAGSAPLAHQPPLHLSLASCREQRQKLVMRYEAGGWKAECSHLYGGFQP
jgi:hypothetical protein